MRGMDFTPLVFGGIFMMISCPRPWVFWGLLLVIPAILTAALWYKRVIRVNLGGDAIISRIRFALPARLFCWVLAWLFLLVGFSGLQWGTHLVPVQQSGSSLALVFDISWSMTAQDVEYEGNRGISRLEAAANYGEMLLTHLDTVDVSVVIAKGEGVVAVPLTRDFNAIRALLPVLSPRLITTTGTSLGSGIQRAASSFPLLSVAKKTVVVLTDGEETDGSLEAEATSLVSSGIDVIFLGFGTTRGTEIFAGDGSTVIHTSLQEEKIKTLVDSINKAVSTKDGGKTGARALYMPAQSLGSAHKILSKVTKQGGEWSGTVYQVKNQERWSVFVALTMVFLCLGFVLGELDIGILKRIFRFKGGEKKLMGLLLVASSFFLQSCSESWQGAAGVLEGTFFWHQGKYQQAVSGFMEAMDISSSTGEDSLLQYSIYGLATTYIMEGETDAALHRLQELSPDAPASLQFAALYNTGVISYNQGKYKEAVSLFRQALEVDGANLDAKINLELSLGQDSRKTTTSSQELIPVQETEGEDFASSTLFSLIRQQEQDRWKNQQDEDASPSGEDY